MSLPKARCPKSPNPRSNKQSNQVVNSKSRLRFMITTGWSSTHSVVTFCKVQTLERWFDCLFDLGFGLFGRLALEAHVVIPIS